MVNESFSDWLVAALQERGWSFSELARRSGISDAMISMVASGQRNPGLDFCVGVGKALGESPEEVLRRAGLLPKLPPEVREEREVLRLLRSLSEGERVMALALLRALRGSRRPAGLEVREGEVGYGEDREPKTASEWLIEQVAAGMEGLSLTDQDRVFKLVKRLQNGEGLAGERA